MDKSNVCQNKFWQLEQDKAIKPVIVVEVYTTKFSHSLVLLKI